jgi:cob(I)alamin adenosyltransferase
MPQQGIIQVYTGEGKGKTSAAIGAVIRALGCGWKVLLVRFLKPVEPESGETAFLRGQAGVEILTSGMGIIAGEGDRRIVAQNVQDTFNLAKQRLTEESFDMAVFDEINNALHRGYLPLAEFLDFLDSKPETLEILLTGRHAPSEVVARAGLVTRLEKVTHPRDLGVPARRGIEF